MVRGYLRPSCCIRNGASVNWRDKTTALFGSGKRAVAIRSVLSTPSRDATPCSCAFRTYPPAHYPSTPRPAAERPYPPPRNGEMRSAPVLLLDGKKKRGIVVPITILSPLSLHSQTRLPFFLLKDATSYQVGGSIASFCTVAPRRRGGHVRACSPR